jgi:hypothetical protein
MLIPDSNRSGGGIKQMLVLYMGRRHHQNAIPSLVEIETLGILASDDDFSATC